MIKDRKKIYIGVLISIVLCMAVQIYFIMNSTCSSRKLIINLTFGTCVSLFFIKEYLDIKMKLKSEEPEINYFINIITNLLLFFNIFNFIIINEFNNSELYVIALEKFIIAKYLIDILYITIYSNDGKWFLFLFITLIIFSILNKNNLEIVTITTTLITTVYGRTFLKNIFSDQINDYLVSIKDGKDYDAIIDKLEYKLIKGNVLLIITHIVVFLTERIRELCVYKDLIAFLDIKDSYFIGIFRIIIVSAVYIISISKLGLRIKNIIFNFLMKDRNDI
ncbi:MAG: hypothetical protein SPI61_07610 [Ezakiella sp.]|uniref:hypothetical protein n=1 Tax=Ezakiella sp. TaxID=1935205 RepID=UPI002A91B6B3|nr:hypothetical protein [Ezakiella sp.]MDY6080574.1 hypothetical protein [Ezakiella sp.]